MFQGDVAVGGAPGMVAPGGEPNKFVGGVLSDGAEPAENGSNDGVPSVDGGGGGRPPSGAGVVGGTGDIPGVVGRAPRGV